MSLPQLWARQTHPDGTCMYNENHDLADGISTIGISPFLSFFDKRDTACLAIDVPQCNWVRRECFATEVGFGDLAPRCAILV
mmetsp:Transcript_2024/g.3943  ORF Transcript_2024/g.3943 Transcript_2024/m.3943 type:complete len:82 (+) Transcript_2024:934-1179(+)